MITSKLRLMLALTAGVAAGLAMLGVAGAFEPSGQAKDSGDLPSDQGDASARISSPPENFTPVEKPYRIGSVSDEERAACASGDSGPEVPSVPGGPTPDPTSLEKAGIRCRIVAAVDAGTLREGQELSEAEFREAMGEEAEVTP